MDKSTRNYPLEDIDRETMFHPNTSIVDHLEKGPHIVAKARGVRIKDNRGRDLIDCGAGLWCVNIGYGRKEMGEAAKKAIENLAYYHIRRRLERADHPPGGARVALVSREGRRTASLQGVLRLGRLGRQRHQLQAQSATTTTCAASPRRRRSSPGSAPIMVSHLRSRPHRHPRLSQGVRSAGGRRAAYSCPHYFRYKTDGESEADFTKRMIAEIEALIAREGADNDRCLHRRADHGHRRRSPAAQGLLREAAEASTSTTSCSSPTRSSPASAAPGTGLRPAA